MLTDAAIEALKPKDKSYKIADRGGMYVVVQPSGPVVCPHRRQSTSNE